MTETPRIAASGELGAAERRLDATLGLLAIVPLFLIAGVAALRWGPPAEMRTAGAIWASCLLAFFAGVRRGLTFSERGGGRATELLTMLGLFALSAVAMLFRSLPLEALGLAAVGVLDAVAGARGEAPPYFRTYRPPQMGAAALAVGWLWLVTHGAG